MAHAAPALRQLELEVHHAFGAIGFAEEHEAPRHFRRVFGDLARLGGARKAREALATHLLADGGTTLPDLDLGERANAFRSEVRAWLAEHWNAAARTRERARPFHQRGVDYDVLPRARPPGLDRGVVAAGIRRSRPRSARAVRVHGGDGAGRRAARRPQLRVRDDRSRADRLRHRGAEGAVPAVVPARRADFQSRLQRVGGGLRPRKPAAARRARRRRLDPRWREALDLARRHRPLPLAGGPHRSCRLATACRHQRIHGAARFAWHHPAHRPRDVWPHVLIRALRPGTRSGHRARRRGRRRLESDHACARQRADRDGVLRRGHPGPVRSAGAPVARAAMRGERCATTRCCATGSAGSPRKSKPRGSWPSTACASSRAAACRSTRRR